MPTYFLKIKIKERKIIECHLLSGMLYWILPNATLKKEEEEEIQFEVAISIILLLY